MSNPMQALHGIGINPFAVTLLAESMLKSAYVKQCGTKPLAFEFPVRRGDCEGWAGVRITIEAVSGVMEAAPAVPAAGGGEAMRTALLRIAAEVPRPSGDRRLRCWHCRNAWVPGHEPERHHDNCALVIAREALAALPAGVQGDRVRMLTMMELLVAKDNHGVYETEDEAIQRKFCEVNGLRIAGSQAGDAGGVAGSDGVPAVDGGKQK